MKTSSPETAPGDWPPLLRFAFRYCVTFLAITTAYLALGHFGSLIGPVAPFLGPIIEWIQYGPAGLMTRYEWATQQLFGAVNYPTIAGFVAYLTTAIGLAGIGALVWTMLDRRRREYARGYTWLRVYMRYLLAAVMLGYGMAKVIPVQFPEPSLVQLMTPVGELTRMRLLWLSMGVAPSYSVFTGMCEVSGALLLFSPRTTTLGALILAASLSNVLALNLSYGIGVQLNVTVYLVMSLALLAPEARRLFDVFFRGPLQPVGARWKAPVKWLLAAWMIGTAVHMVWVERAWAQPNSALYGIYDVEEFVRGGVALAAGDNLRWRHLVVAERDTAAIQRTDGGLDRYRAAVDTAAHTLTLTPTDDKAEPLILHYSQESDGRLIVDGTIQGNAVRARLRMTDAPRFLLRQPLK